MALDQSTLSSRIRAVNPARSITDLFTRRLPSRLFNRVTGRLSGLRLHDLNSGLKAYRADVVRNLRIYGELHRYIPVLAHYRGFRVAELPVHHRPREHGRSHYGMERYVRGFLDLLTVTFMGRYRHRPLHLFGAAGLVILIAFLLIVLPGQLLGYFLAITALETSGVPVKSLD